MNAFHAKDAKVNSAKSAMFYILAAALYFALSVAFLWKSISVVLHARMNF